MCWDPTNVRVNHSSHDTEASLTNLSRGPEDLFVQATTSGGQRLRLPSEQINLFFFLALQNREQKVGFLRIKSGSPPFPLLEAFGSHHWPGETTPFRVNLRARRGAQVGAEEHPATEEDIDRARAPAGPPVVLSVVWARCRRCPCQGSL